MFISFSFFEYFRVLYLDLRLNFILFLSVTQVIRRLSLEIDSCLSRRDHVPVPGWDTPQIFFPTVTVDLSQVLSPSSR